MSSGICLLPPLVRVLIQLLKGLSTIEFESSLCMLWIQFLLDQRSASIFPFIHYALGVGLRPLLSITSERRCPWIFALNVL